MTKQTQIHIPRSKVKELTFIRVRRQNRNPNTSDRRVVVGLDTETEDGNIFLLCDSFQNKIEYPNITFNNIVRFLFKHEGSWLFFYNLQYDAECILKLLPSEVFNPYRKYKKMKFKHNGYEIAYIPKKQLTIRMGKHSVSCYDIAQYYDNVPLQKAYAEYIKKPLDDSYLEMKKKRKFFSLNYFLRHKKEIRKYCVQDCILTKELSENWLDIFSDVFKFYPRNWVSSGYLAEKVSIFYKIDIPFFHDTKYEIQDLAWKSFYGGRFELVQRGHIGECYLYDINSAYPFALTNLPDIKDGRWKESNKINPKALLGFFHIQARIDDAVKIAPFPFRTKNNRIIYPTGEFETYVTLEELKSVIGDSRIKFKIIDSYQFIPSKNCKFPFKKFIEEQYSKRLELKSQNNPLERAIKIVLNSMYGKTAQRVDNKMGNLFNPIIASFITGFARAHLYRFMREYDLEHQIVAFATDSVACRKRIEGLNSANLGEMKLDKDGKDVYFLSNGFYRFNGKWKNRGIGYDNEKKIEIEHQDTKVGNDGQLYITIKTTRTTHIKSGIIYDKLDQIGKIEPYEKKIDLNSDKKRFWFSELKSIDGKTCCDSTPIRIDLVGDVIAENNFGWDKVEELYEPESDL
ncbi:MAG: DNA polymerase [Nitrosopumilaceae archaeon]